MKRLFLDDVRRAPIGWDVVRSHAAFVNYIEQHGCPDVIAFDHDLAEEHYAAYHAGGYNAPFSEPTGLDSARWCIENGHIPQQVIVHSFNPAGARNIAAEFEGKSAVLVRPYGEWMMIL